MKKSDKALAVLKQKMVDFEESYSAERWLEIVNYELSLDDMISLSTLRKLLALLPLNKQRVGKKWVYGLTAPDPEKIHGWLSVLTDNGQYPVLMDTAVTMISQYLTAYAHDVHEMIVAMIRYYPRNLGYVQGGTICMVKVTPNLKWGE